MISKYTKFLKALIVASSIVPVISVAAVSAEDAIERRLSLFRRASWLVVCRDDKGECWQDLDEILAQEPNLVNQVSEDDRICRCCNESSFGQTLLMMCAHKGLIGPTKIILKHNPDTDITCEGKTALDFARDKQKLGHSSIENNQSSIAYNQDADERKSAQKNLVRDKRRLKAFDTVVKLLQNYVSPAQREALACQEAEQQAILAKKERLQEKRRRQKAQQQERRLQEEDDEEFQSLMAQMSGQSVE